jgi:hypothetical protein
MEVYSSRDLLYAWERHHGKLEEKWILRFLAQSEVQEIIKLKPTYIDQAIAANKKLSSILGYLKSNFVMRDYKNRSARYDDSDESVAKLSRALAKGKTGTNATDDWWRHD